jgi:subtilisin family serine protease
MKKVAFFICLLFGFLLLFQLNTYAMENNSEKIEKIKKILTEHNQRQLIKEKDYIEDEVIVMLKPSFTKTLSSLNNNEVIDRISSKIQMLNLNFKHVRRLGPQSEFFLIKFDKEKETFESVKSKLLNSSDIEIVEPNYIRKFQGTIPNDFYNFDLWGLQKINAQGAWDITKGSSEVVVAVIDSGVDYTHEDLAQNIWINTREIPDNGIDDDGNGYIDDVYGIAPGYSDISNIEVTDPMDVNGHGTHVAGIIGAVGNNGKGVVGVNWNVKILSCNAASPVSALLSGTLECYAYIGLMKDRGVNIKAVNASYGGSYSYAEELSIQSKLKAKGILLIAAAGNQGKNNDTAPTYPCNYNLDNIICVASTDRNDNLSWFSNYGNSVHVAAPGEEIYSTYPITSENFNPSFCNNIFFDNFESGTGNWYFGSPAGLSTKYSLSPTHSITDSVDGNYPNNTLIPIISRNIDLSSYKNSKIFGYFSVRPYLATEDTGGLIFSYNDLDKIFIPFVINGNIIDLLNIRGKWKSWSFYIPKDFRKYNSQIALVLISNNDGVTDDGVYWDDIGICSISSPTNKYAPLQGTSMAAPFVTGLAALIWSKEPQLSYLDVKNRILSSVDVLPQLSGKVASSGRINSYKALSGSSCTPPFTDVPCDHWAINYIKAVKDAGITKGCNPPQNDRFCPEDVVTRAQMAAFIIRAIEGEPTNYSTNPYFSDVPSSHWAFKYIQRVKERNIAQGYAGTNLYGPEDNVTREQMAKMLIMGLVSQGKTSEPPTDYCSTGAPFDDVSPSSWSCRYIKKLKELGITQGCNPPQNNRYCPQNPVTRAQMATFIYRGFLQ